MFGASQLLHFLMVQIGIKRISQSKKEKSMMLDAFEHRDMDVSEYGIFLMMMHIQC